MNTPEYSSPDQRRAGWVLKAHGVSQAYDSNHHNVSEE